MNETEAAAGIATGALPSPLRFGNSALVAIRISGTGAAERPAIGEKVWRDPAVWLSDETLARVAGLPVIVDHPEAVALDAEEYADRAIGAVLLPYVANRDGIQDPAGPDLWAVSRLFLDDDQLEQIADRSTSPGVVFTKADGNEMITLPDGTTCLVEASPTLIDHVAIVMSGDGAGVWDKGGENSGIRFDSKGTTMTEEEMEADRVHRDTEEKAEREDRARKDAEGGGNIDKMLSRLDTFMDSMSKRMDALEARKESTEETEAEKKAREARERADAAEIDHGKLRRDASEARVRHDAAVSQQRKIEETELVGIQGRADPVSQAFGQRAPMAYQGEKPLSYRKRLLRGFQGHSQVFKDVDVDLIAADAVTFDRIEAQVYADALVASKTPTFADDQVHYRTRTTESGHRITEGFGRHTIFKSLSAPTLRVTAFLTPNSDRRA